MLLNFDGFSLLQPYAISEALTFPELGLDASFITADTLVIEKPASPGPLYAPLPDDAALAYSFEIVSDADGGYFSMMVDLDPGLYFLDIPEDLGRISVSIFPPGFAGGFSSISPTQATVFEIETAGTYELRLLSLPPATTFDLDVYSTVMPDDLYESLLYQTNNRLTRWHTDGIETGYETVLFYAFNADSSQGNYQNGATEENFVIFNDAYKAMVRSAMAQASNETGLTFIEVDPDDPNVTPNLLLHGNRFINGGGGYAEFPFGKTTLDITIFHEPERTNITYSSTLLLHELGHTLGLKHPGDVAGDFDAITDPDIKALYENEFFTLMTGGQGSFQPVLGYRPFDIMALDYLYGSAEDAVDYSYNAATGLVTVTGTDGNDEFAGSTQDDLIFAGAGDDIIIAVSGDDEIHGGAGRDRIVSGDGADTLYGDAGTDFMLGGGARDTMFGGAQSDRMFGQDGNDIMIGGGSNDIMHGGGNADIMYGGLGNDNMNGGSNVDRLYGQENNDTIYGGNAGDRIDGGSGNDMLFGGNRGGADGFGDTFIFANNFGTDVIGDFEDGLDVIDFSGHTAINSFADVLARASEDGSSLLIATNANNTLIIENFSLAELDASDFVF